MTTAFRLLCTALTFLTRLPFARWSYAEPERLAQASIFFPLVGAVVAAIACAAAWLGHELLPASLIAWCALLAAIVTTGGFHEDGLADTADGLGGGTTLERRLAIMKDSRLGTYAALALLLALGGKYLALASLPLRHMFEALWLGHVLARWSVLPLAAWLPYVRDAGASNKPIADGIRARELLIGSVITALLIAPFGMTAIACSIASLIVVVLTGLYFRSQLGGITGDTLGAANQSVELCCYLVCAALLR